MRQPRHNTILEEDREGFISQLLDTLAEIKEDIEMSRDNLTFQAKEHINDNDIILTHGYSNTLCQFFKEARQTVKFELIVLETAPSFQGHKTAKELANAGIKVTLAQDASVFALMSRVDKVFISPQGIMASGGIIGHSGNLMIAMAAQAHKVPYFAIGSIYKLTPLHPTDQHSYNEFYDPASILRLDHFDFPENISAVQPAFDYVPPKLVSLILTSQEGYTPQNIYKAFQELYGRQGSHLNIEE